MKNINELYAVLDLQSSSARCNTLMNRLCALRLATPCRDTPKP